MEISMEGCFLYMTKCSQLIHSHRALSFQRNKFLTIIHGIKRSDGNQHSLQD